ncbi:tank-1 [Symbiodinium sp. CCMP2456]|nr:tank-1 [Symbiodinium sp. CCMP2456]
MSDESDDDAVEAEEKEPLEEMRGWLMCYGEPSGGNRLQVARLAKASAGTPVAGLFWKKRYIQLVDAQLLCWATAPQHRGSRVAPVAVLLLAQLEEVAVTGKTLTLHMRNQKGCLQARADSDESANTWARAVKAHAGRAISKSLPPGWDVEAMLSRGMGGSAAKMVNKETLDSSCNDAFQKLLDHCFVCKTTKDRRGNPVPMRLEIAEAVRVQNGAAWLEYDKARRRICDKVFSAYQWDKQHSDSESCSSSMTAAERGLHSAHTTVSDLGSSEGQSWDPFGLQSSLLTSTLDCKQLQETLGKRDTSSNEQWLFHGTSAAAVQHISDQEFRLDKAGSHRGTLYGKGIYFAECVTKADEYCEEDADGYCWMLLCRVALGKVMTCKEKKPPADILDQCKAGGYDSLLGDRWAAVGTFREFILYDSDQVYPAFILRYRRWSEAAFCRSIRESADSGDPVAHDLYPHAAILAEEHPDSTVRYRLSLLMEAHAENVVPVLCEALKDPRRRVRLNATKALMNMAGQTSTVEALPDGSRYRRHREGMHVVVSAVPALTTCLTDSDSVSTTAVLEVLMDALEDPSSEVKSAAAAALGMLSAPVATDALATCLADAQSHVRAAAAKAIGQIGGKSASTAVPKLLQTLKDPDHVVRRCSAVSLGRIGTFAATAAPYLADAMRDSHAPVREAAAISISRLGVTEKVAHNVCIQCLVKRGLTDTSSDVRQAAAESLLDLARTEQLGVQKAFVREAMTTRMKDDNAKVRATASTCLNMLSLQEDALCRQKLRQRHKAKKKIDSTRGEQAEVDEDIALEEEDIDMLRDSVLELEDIARLVINLTRHVRD